MLNSNKKKGKENMGKSKWKVGMASALAVGAGAAAVVAGRKKKSKTLKESNYRNTERGRQAKNSKGIYYSSGNYEALRGRRSRKVLKGNLHIWLEVVWLH